MSVEQIKSSLKSLNQDELKEVFLYIRQLRSDADLEQRELLAARLDDKNPANWVSLDELKRRYPGEWREDEDSLDPEIARLLGELDGMFDEDRHAGRLDADKVAAAIQAHRERHPYGR